MSTWRTSMSSSKNVGGSVEKNSPEVSLSGSCVLILVLLTSHGLTLGLVARGVGHSWASGQSKCGQVFHFDWCGFFYWCVKGWVELQFWFFVGLLSFQVLVFDWANTSTPGGFYNLWYCTGHHILSGTANNSNEIQVSNCIAFRRRMTRISNACENMAGFPNPLNPLKIIKTNVYL